jgi:hypothetical protein
MSNNTEPNERTEIANGLCLLMILHFVAFLIIFRLSELVSSTQGNDKGLSFVITGIAGFLFWQLLYVIPLIIWLRRRGKVAMMKGVVIGAVLTALANGVCFLVVTA